MQETVLIKKLDIQRSHMSFILPIGYDDRKKNDFSHTLEKNGYTYFQINDNLSGMDLLRRRNCS